LITIEYDGFRLVLVFDTVVRPCPHPRRSCPFFFRIEPGVPPTPPQYDKQITNIYSKKGDIEIRKSFNAFLFISHAGPKPVLFTGERGVA
jgi:hypothetical protein